MRPSDRELADRLEAQLLSFEQDKRPLRGIQSIAARRTLIEQIVASKHRVKYVEVVRLRDVSDRRADPNDDLFNPLKAAILYQRRGDTDEAFWLVFLFVHFGEHRRAEWRYAREVYGRLGEPTRWDWKSVSANPAAFRLWLGEHIDGIRRPGVPGGFGNHRKYQSLDSHSPTGTGAAVETYVRWVDPPRRHQELVDEARSRSGDDRRRTFDDLYSSMRSVASFGRMARFDYLTMIGKLDLAPIEPGSAYLQGSTGPVDGARLLIGGPRGTALSVSELDRLLIDLDGYLRVGMQVIEDSLCNWQKSPTVYRQFRG